MHLDDALRRSTRLALLGVSLLFAGSSQADERADHFRNKVEPLLKRHCYECHSHAAGQMENGLALDWKSGWTTGGDRGPAIVPGKPDESLLIRAVRHSDPNLKMPEQKLDAADQAVLEAWVLQGAFDDRVAAPQKPEIELWWSLKPLVAPPLPVRPATPEPADDNPIDAFIEARLARAGLRPSPAATPRELIRRLYFDLIGLPPSADEVARFEADPSDSAYRQIVDRLLSSPRYGERWARHWFDTIHFADSHGYEHDVGRDHAWPYRDYVIDALNTDRPWATFIRQQLAVDHFEPESSHLKPALGFLGAGTFDYSTYATGPVTFDYLDRDDLLTQTMAAFVSATANCARCHNHKFDPITHEDYYSLQAVFAGVVKGDVPYDPDPEVGARRRRLLTTLDDARRGDAAALETPFARELVASWTKLRGPGADWKPLELQSFLSTEGASLTRDADGVVVAGGPAPESDVYLLTATVPLPRVTALRLDLLPHDSLPMKGPGRCHNGNLHLSEIVATLFAPGEKTGRPIPFVQATADFNQEGWGVQRAIDGDPKTAWGIFPAVGAPHHAVFQLAQPLALPAGSTLAVSLKQLHGGAHLIGAFKLSATDSPAPQTVALPIEAEQALKIVDSERTPDQRLAAARHVVALAAESELARLPRPATVYAAAASVEIPKGVGGQQPASLPVPKVVHVLQRGDIGKPRGEATPGAISALSHLPGRFTHIPPQNEAARRAALADWIAHPDNGLTWRSAVNRVWHFHFGRGLCDTPSDLGRMGGVPSHPELIDWLAVWFRDETGGSLKSLHRLIVTSRTYRQSSRSRPDAASLDADNRWLWRQNRLRLDADAYRDYALTAAGRLDLTAGGPGVQHFLQSPGAQLTPKLDYAAYDWASPGAARRSIYRFVWRGIPDPLFAALDFPDLGLLAPTRTDSISPLQALALFNNHFVLFQSEAMAQQLAARSPDLDAQIVEAVRRAYQRAPAGDELDAYRAYVQRHGTAAFCRLLLNSSEFLYVP